MNSHKIPVIPMVFLEEIDSTSKYAQKLVFDPKFQKEKYFAVSAKSQTQGRGQGQHNWVSPRGNTYLTIVLQEQISLSDLERLSAIAGLMICDFLFLRYGFRPLWRWPNDILMGGKKLAGVLCESQIMGQAVERIFIGIGLNVNCIPDLQQHPLHIATNLKNILFETSDLDTQTLAQDLADYFVNHFKRCIEKEWFDEAVSLYGLNQGMAIDVKMSAEEKESSYFFQRLDLSAMNLYVQTTSQSNTSLSLKKIDSLRWQWQGQGLKKPLYIVDIGNSNIKIYECSPASDEHLEFIASCAVDDPKLTEFLVKLIQKHQLTRLQVSSVNPRLDRFKEICREQGVDLLWIQKRCVYLRKSSYDLALLGIDRLAVIESAIKESMRRHFAQGVIVVNCGTAITIDVITPTKEHTGGLILPGFEAYFSGVKQFMPALEKYVPRKIKEEMGDVLKVLEIKSTTEALNQGFHLAVYGALNTLRENFTSRWQKSPQIIFTGAYGQFFSYNQSIYIADMVAKGLKILTLVG